MFMPTATGWSAKWITPHPNPPRNSVQRDFYFGPKNNFNWPNRSILATKLAPSAMDFTANWNKWGFAMW